MILMIYTIDTDIVSLVKDNNRRFGYLFGNHLSNFWIEQIVVAVHYNVGMCDLFIKS